MKRLRFEKWSGQLLGARPGAASASASCSKPFRTHHLFSSQRSQWTLAAAETPHGEGGEESASHRFPPLDPGSAGLTATFPSPPPERALSSAKLAALHARLALSEKIPLQTLARALIDATADENPRFNNSNLSFLGQTLINYHISEWLMCRYPRLPMSIMYAAMSAYGGVKPLHQIARQWGVESAAAPGGEVDAGLLQFSTRKPGITNTGFGYRRTEAAYLEKFKWRRGINSRVVLDDDFGDVVNEVLPEEEGQDGAAEVSEDGPLKPYGTPETRQVAENAHAQFVRAVVGATYAHCGREAVKSFVRSHVLARQLDLSSLFSFKLPTRELAQLCAREEFERPVARLLSETGRRSRTPVFVVGIYSGKDKLGEGAGPNLDSARWKAAMNSLKAWYLYSPGENVRVPSDMLAEDAKSWEPVYIDIGEVV
ncbi:ribonuclease III [Phialemonium atrogriseum]|uniref:Large ribosomal subunit protein mL44 n=1 Tax=Phialemonium atrogriseum TaxID=1093897 RepID=A0AAJ0FFR8_9PEZI|nr:ribonuclease III [Phialemonium atrogriseum]KAK1766841.1 ribonuclease III [Phialemonium atrogriseum]